MYTLTEQVTQRKFGPNEGKPLGLISGGFLLQLFLCLLPNL